MPPHSIPSPNLYIATALLPFLTNLKYVHATFFKIQYPLLKTVQNQISWLLMFCLFVLMLYILVNLFSVMLGRFPGFPG